MNIEAIKKRSQILKTIRNFFEDKNYLEIETPILSPSLIPESAIEIFKTENVHPYKNSREMYLVPSPEIWLKRFISEHKVNVFEISKCFRNSEQMGKHHNPEFSMIEYYTMDYTHLDSINLTKKLIDYLNKEIPYSQLPKQHMEMTMEEAFIKYAGFSLKRNLSIKDLKRQAIKLNIPTEDNDDWESSFNRIFVDIIEPNLPKDVNLFLKDFPSEIKTLARGIEGTPWACRWELYINGIETANCYYEENKTETVKRFFKEESIIKKTAMVQHNIDLTYPDIFKDFPNCSGVAIGLDRLIMEILGSETIEGVILFPYRDNI